MSTALERLAAALTDRYRIERELGAGGMATVYLAHDLRHDRDVAIKVLHPDLGAALGSDRFLSEIRTTARLQHPHILPLLDSGEADGLLYYVMPLVTGETLRTRLERERQLPVEDAVRIAAEVADALSYAHGLSVVHRDIKPENILLQGGHALVADFGIALAVQSAGGKRMTQTGLSLGTPQYMSPEQAMGERTVDARSDLYAVGAVTYEMLVGEPPFTGPSVQAIVARLVTEEPRPITLQRRAVPSHVEAAVLRALEKLPADRFDSARAFADALKNPAFPPAGVSRRPALRSPSAAHRGTWAAMGVAAIALILAALGWLRPRPTAAPSRQRVTLWQHAFAQFLAPGVDRNSNQAAIAPDGSSIVFSDSAGATTRLFRKLKSESDPTPMAGTDGALSPFFSPDGQWVGYLSADGRLKKIPVAGGGAITLAEDVHFVYLAAAWLDDNTIVYVDRNSGIRRVSATGTSAPMMLSDSLTRRVTIPVLAPLPGSRGFLLTMCPGNCSITSEVAVWDFAADSARRLVANAAGAWYSPTGHLLYTDRAGGLFAVRFDLKRLALTSGAIPVIDDVAPAAFALSASGSALYSLEPGSTGSSMLMWVSRDGSSQPVDSTWRAQFEYPAVSPDGGAIAVSLRNGSTQLWVRRSDGTRQKLTQEGTVNWRPSWTHQGQSLVFASNMRGGGSRDDFDLLLMRVDGSAAPQLLHRHTFGLWEGEISEDGQWLVFRSDEEGTNGNIRVRRIAGDTALRPLVVDEFTSTQVALSPESRWLAYTSDATGRREIYITPFPGGGSTRLVSRDGGTEPRWARSGRELFYKSGDRLMAVDVAPGPALGLGVPRPLFSVSGYQSARNRQQYDVAPGDQRFLMIRNAGGDGPVTAIYVENWLTELREKLKQ